jgi:hypothetical protein
VDGCRFAIVVFQGFGFLQAEPPRRSEDREISTYRSVKQYKSKRRKMTKQCSAGGKLFQIETLLQRATMEGARELGRGQSVYVCVEKRSERAQFGGIRSSDPFQQTVKGETFI